MQLIHSCSARGKGGTSPPTFGKLGPRLLTKSNEKIWGRKRVLSWALKYWPHLIPPHFLKAGTATINSDLGFFPLQGQPHVWYGFLLQCRNILDSVFGGLVQVLGGKKLFFCSLLPRVKYYFTFFFFFCISTYQISYSYSNLKKLLQFATFY